MKNWECVLNVRRWFRRLRVVITLLVDVATNIVMYVLQSGEHALIEIKNKKKIYYNTKKKILNYFKYFM